MPSPWIMGSKEVGEMLGKSAREYWRLQRGLLLAIVAVWAVRFALGAAGFSGARFASVTWLLLAGAIYYGVVVARRGFGTYRHLYPLNLFQSLLAESLVGLGIAISILTGRENIFTTPEFAVGFEGMSWAHALAHIIVPGAIVLPLVGWALSSAVMALTRWLAPRA